MSSFPFSYRWFIAKGLVNWQPWQIRDTKDSVARSPDFSRWANFAKQFRLETGADFDVYLFARRQDMDDFAFFVVDNGKILDQVVTIHLTFSGRPEFRIKLERSHVTRSFVEWVRDIALRDLSDWISEEDSEEDLDSWPDIHQQIWG